MLLFGLFLRHGRIFLKNHPRELVRTLSRMLQLQLQAVQGYRYFKNKNRLLKKYFHETNFIFQQMLFSINSTLTIQSLIYEIKTNNGETVAEYFNEDDNSCTSSMTSLGPLLYAVGKIKAINLTGQQQDLLEYSNTNLTFSHLCKEGQYITQQLMVMASKTTVFVCIDNNTLIPSNSDK